MSTRDVYNKFASQYHDKRSELGRNLWNEYLDFPAVSSLLPASLEGLQLVDLGCGSGIFSRRFQALGATVQGVDISAELIAIAKQHNPSISFSVADVADTRLQPQSYDVAVSCLVAHYLSDLEPFFREAARLLRRPGGKFIFSFHHPVNEVMQFDGDKFVLQPYFHNNAYKWQMLKGMELQSYHHTFEQIIGTLFRAGFVVEELKEARPSPDLAERFPDFYQATSNYPTFAAIRASVR